MRKFSYKEGKAIIRTLKEPKIEKKRWNFDRILFIVVLIGLSYWLMSFVYKKTAWIYGNGQILMEKVDVNFTKDIRLKEIYINEGQSVSVKDTLFRYFQDEFDSDASLLVKGIDRQEALGLSLEKLRREIQLKRAMLGAQQRRLNMVTEREKELINLVVLDVYTKPKLDEIRANIAAIEEAIFLLKNEIYLLDTHRKRQNKVYKTGSIYTSGHINNYISPINGVIGQIHKNSEEACYKKERVMTIHNKDKVFIKAYFDLNDASSINQGTTVIVELPNGFKSKGIINKLYIATYEAPTEFQKKYEPTERNILAEIIPLEEKEIPYWAQYYKLNLKVKLSRY